MMALVVAIAGMIFPAMADAFDQPSLLFEHRSFSLSHSLTHSLTHSLSLSITPYFTYIYR
jgi:hypothetical protein